MSYQVVLSTFLPNGSELSLILIASAIPKRAARAITLENCIFVLLLFYVIIILLFFLQAKIIKGRF